MAIKDVIDSYDPNRPLAEASTLPASWYLDPEVAELERRITFSRSWQPAARAEQLKDAGAYVTFRIAGEPGVLVRGADKVLRAFFNVCRHHAASVVTEPWGKAAQLRCPYHGWTYSLDGNLKAAPDMGTVTDFDHESISLAPIDAVTWKIWAWVNLADRATPLDYSLPGLTLENLHWLERRHYRLECNWKVFVDNYLDGGYHVPLLHKELDRVLNYSEYQIELGNQWCLQWSPLDGGGRALYYWIYPNFMINLYPDAMDTNLVIPSGDGQTEVIFDFYFADISDEARRRNQARIALSEAIQHQDAAICESVQRGLASRSYNAGRLSVRREAGEHLFHRLLYSDLKSGILELIVE
jgi:choline monooxygenase